MRDVDTGKDLADDLKWVSSPAPPGPTTARASSTAATTSRRPGEELERGQLLPEALLPPARHAAGRGRARLRAARPARSGASAATVTEDGRYLVIHVWQGHRAEEPRLLQGPARSPTRQVVELLDELRRRVRLHRQRRPGLLFQTDLDAPRGRVDRDRHPQARRARTGRRSSRRPRTRSQASSVVGDQLRRQLPEGRPHAGEASSTLDGKLAARRRSCPASARAAASAASASDTRDVLLVHQLHHAGDASTATT